MGCAPWTAVTTDCNTQCSIEENAQCSMEENAQCSIEENAQCSIEENTQCSMEEITQCSMEENSKHGSLRYDISEKCKILKVRCHWDHDDDHCTAVLDVK